MFRFFLFIFLILTLHVDLAISHETKEVLPKIEEEGVTLYDKDGKLVRIGGRIQVQYHLKDPDTGDSFDTVFFRGLRTYITGSIHENWAGKFQIDFGKGEDDNEVAVKDAYLQYKGFKGMKLTLGNAKHMFSRKNLTSSKKQQLVARTFVGDHNYGSVDRNLGLHITGVTYGEKAYLCSECWCVSNRS